MGQPEDQPHVDTWLDLHLLKTPHLREHANLLTPCHIGARPHARITLHMSSFVPNHTPHNPETVTTNARLYKAELASPSRYILTFHNTSFTLFLSSITDLSVRVLTCLYAPFFPLRRLVAAIPEAVTVTPEHSLSPLPLICFHQTDQECLLKISWSL